MALLTYLCFAERARNKDTAGINPRPECLSDALVNKPLGHLAEEWRTSILHRGLSQIPIDSDSSESGNQYLAEAPRQCCLSSSPLLGVQVA